MKRQIELEHESEPDRKISTCDSLQAYMLIKEKQFLKHGRFFSTPICFRRNVQDHCDPMNKDGDIFSLWETLCLQAFTFPIWKYKHDFNKYACIVDELSDLLIIEVKAASFAWMTTWEEWQEWDQFLLFSIAKNTQLFRHFEKECIKLIHSVDLQLYQRKSNVHFDIIPDFPTPSDIPRYFQSSVYSSEFPNFYLLTTQERQLWKTSE